MNVEHQMPARMILSARRRGTGAAAVGIFLALLFAPVISVAQISIFDEQTSARPSPERFEEKNTDYDAQDSLDTVESSRAETRLKQITQARDEHVAHMENECKCYGSGKAACNGIALTASPLGQDHFTKKVRKRVWFNGTDEWVTAKTGWRTITVDAPDRAAYQRYLAKLDREREASEKRAKVRDRTCRAWIAGKDVSFENYEAEVLALERDLKRAIELDTQLINERNAAAEIAEQLDLDARQRELEAEQLRKQLLASEATAKREESLLGWCEKEWSAGRRPCDCWKWDVKPRPEPSSCHQ